MINYLIHSSILLTGSVLFYWLFLKKETFFRLNRWTFVSCILLSLILPLITVPAAFSLKTADLIGPALVEKISDNSLSDYVESAISSAVTDSALPSAEADSPSVIPAESGYTWPTIIMAIYLVGVLIFAFVFLLQVIVLMTRKYNLNTVKTGKYSIVELVREQEPYSFMNTIFINPESYDPETYEQIIAHEKLHIDQAHFIDKLLAELTIILFWFNPFVWVLRSAIGKNLEFLTDQSLLNNGMEKESYQMSLIKVSVSTKPFNLTTSYNNSFLKNRILMMNSKKSSIASIWKYLFIPPLFLFSLISLNAVEENKDLQDLAVVQQEKFPQDAIQEEKISKKLNTEKSKAKADSKVSAKNKSKSKTSPPSDHGNTKHECAPSNFGKAFCEDPAHKVNNKVLDLPTINNIAVANNNNVFITQSKTQRIRVEGPDHLIEKLNKKVKDGHWSIYYLEKIENLKSESLTIHIEVKDLENLVLSGSGTIASKNTFNTEGKFNLINSGSGKIKFDFKSNYLDCILSGTGSVNMVGVATSSVIVISGNGNLSADNFKTDNCNITISGTGNIEMQVAESLNATISGTGNIKVKGDPKVNSTVSGTGQVIKVR